MFFTFVMASAAIVLAWLRTKEEERSQKINELSVLVTYRSDTLVMLFSEVKVLLLMEALGNA